MTIVGLVLSVFGIGLLCWLVLMLAVYALPFHAGLSTAFAAYRSGAPVLSAAMVGFVTGATTSLMGQLAFARTRSPLIRSVTALIYAVPAIVAGFSMTFGLSRIGTPSRVWSDILAVVGTLYVGVHHAYPDGCDTGLQIPMVDKCRSRSKPVPATTLWHAALRYFSTAMHESPKVAPRRRGAAMTVMSQAAA